MSDHVTNISGAMPGLENPTTSVTNPYARPPSARYDSPSGRGVGASGSHHRNYSTSLSSLKPHLGDTNPKK